MAVPFKKDPMEFNQRKLFPSCIFDLLPPDHECFIYDEIFKLLDTSSVEEHYSIRGQNAYHPRLITAILIYAYSQDIFSSRQIEKKCHEDLGFMYISHLNCPNFRVLSDFRKNHGEFFKDCFVQSALLAKELGMVSLGHVSTDGSKFKANTSKHKAMSYAHLKAQEEQLVKEIEELLAKAEQCDEGEDLQYGDKRGEEIPDELAIKGKRLEKIRKAKEALEKREHELNPGEPIEGKKQISFADEEARIMGKKGSFDYAYNAQISADEDHQIIVGQHLSQNANDKKEVEAALEEIEQTVGELPEKLSLDNGYMSGNNLEALEQREVDAYVATGKEDKKDSRAIEDSNRELKKSDFIYDSEKDVFLCPGGHELELKHEGKDGKKVYKASKEACSECPFRKRCCKSKKGNPRSISADDKEPLRQKMIEKMEQESSKQVYKKRKQIVEPVFGQIKNGGFRQFLLRGFKKASGEFSLVCAVHNIKKVVRRVLSGAVCLEIDKICHQTT
jgi:transposase